MPSLHFNLYLLFIFKRECINKEPIKWNVNNSIVNGTDLAPVTVSIENVPDTEFTDTVEVKNRPNVFIPVPERQVVRKFSRKAKKVEDHVMVDKKDDQNMVKDDIITQPKPTHVSDNELVIEENVDRIDVAEANIEIPQIVKEIIAEDVINRLMDEIRISNVNPIIQTESGFIH